MFHRFSQRPIVLRALVVGLLLTLVSAAMVSGQTTQSTFYACLDTKKGELTNVVQSPGTPPECTKKDQVPVSWNQPQALTIEDGSITTVKMADGAVTSAKIALGAVTTDRIADDAVTADKIDAGAVGTAELAESAVTSAKIVNGTVSSDDIGDGAVGNDDLAAGAVGTANIQDGAVNGDKVADGSISAADLASNSVGSDEIASDAVGADEIATNAVGTSEIADGSVSSTDLATNSVGSDEIANGSIASVDIANGAVTTAKQTANASMGLTGGGGSNSLNPGQGRSFATATLEIPSGGNHFVMVTGQVRIYCPCSPGVQAVLFINVYDDIGVAVTPEPTVIVLQSGSPVQTVPVTGLATSAPGVRTYRMDVFYSSSPSGQFVTVESSTLLTVDLGLAQ